MSERGEALKRTCVEAFHWWYNSSGDSVDDAALVARAICEHMGLTWEAVERLNDVLDALDDDMHRGPEGIEVHIEPQYAAIAEIRDAIATLLEAAGIER